MDQLLGELTDDEDMLELINILELVRVRKTYRERYNHFTKWNDVDFIKRFRLSKNGVRFLLENIREHISHPTDRNHAVCAEDMIFMTLRFFATGSFLQVVGDFIGIDKSTASRIVNRVSRTIARLHYRFITMPQTEDEMRRNSQEFYNIGRFPRCIGALDCTHIKIISPGGPEPEVYRNRKSFFSFNVQCICDAMCRIQNVICRWPGSTHDSTIFNNSRVRTNFENGDYGTFVLVGDSGYGIRPYLLTPLSNPATPSEQLFNEAQIRTRNPIERCFGIWKRRFPVLAFGIRLDVQKVEAIVVATAVLHNIACLLNEELPPADPEEEAAVEFVNNVEIVPLRENADVNRNNLIRFQLINDYFARLIEHV